MPSLTTVIAALLIALPLLSVTAPAIPPPNDCAEATLAIASKVLNMNIILISCELRTKFLLLLTWDSL